MRSHAELFARLGPFAQTGFIDSSGIVEERSIYWHCGCRASQLPDGGDRWRHEPCGLGQADVEESERPQRPGAIERNLG